MLRSAASPGSRGVRPVGRRYEWPPHDTATDRPLRLGAFRSGRARSRPHVSPSREISRARPHSPALWQGSLQLHPSKIKVHDTRRLFDLGFAELDVLLGHWIVFLFHQLIRHRARVLARDVIEPGIRARYQLYFYGRGFGHG